jgi:plasmid stability protein
MNTHIQIRNVPNATHRKLKSRAAEKGQSLSDYIKNILVADAKKPTLAEMAERLRKLPPVTTTDEIVSIIREVRDSH